MLKQVQHDVVGRQQRTKTVTLISFQGLLYFTDQSEMLKQVQHDVAGRQQRTKTVTLNLFQGLSFCID